MWQAAAFGLITLASDCRVNKKMKTNDDTLVDGILQIVATKGNEIDPGNIEEIVGLRAKINTKRPKDKLFYLRANIILDTVRSNQIKRLDEVCDVVYWERPVQSLNPRLIGIGWNKKKQPKVFFGICLPP